jgi:uncharacterized protein (DUF2235 family)
MDLNMQHYHSDICLCTTDKVDSAASCRGGCRLVVAFDGTQNQFGPEVWKFGYNPLEEYNS